MKTSKRPAAAPKAAKPSFPRLLTKRDVCALTGFSYQTIWGWMQRGQFPRSRFIGGKSSRTVWLPSEIEEWLNTLPKRRLKGDAEVAA
jgi:predicted DNA-binding transcriptional regulator AlpA